MLQLELQSNNREIEFIEDEHIYLVDGVIVPSVSDLLSFKFPNKYRFVSDDVLEKAAERGTEIHKAIEDYEVHGIDTDHYAVKQFKFLKKQYNFKVIKAEQMVLIESYNGNLVCGRYDLMIEKAGNELDFKHGTGLADIKSTSVLDKESLAYQLNLYRLGEIQAGNRVDFLSALHIREDKRKYINIPIAEKEAFELIDDYYREVLHK